MKRRIVALTLCLALLGAMAINYSGCTLRVAAKELTEGYAPGEVPARAADDAFIDAQLSLAASLFRTVAADERGDNVMISPLSIALALSMLTNGAAGETRAELERLLGGDLGIEALNEYLHSYVASLPSGDKSKLSIASSLWLRDDGRLEVSPEFLQTCVDWYDPDVFSSDFGRRTVRDMNNWASNATDGMIDEVVEEIDPDVLMYIVNAIVFDAEWQRIYERSDVRKGEFKNADGERERVDFMSSTEHTYIETEDAVGFVKSYVGNYRFVALLPREDITLDQYIATLDGKTLRATLDSAQSATVHASMPKFEYDCDTDLVDVLRALGVERALDGSLADLSALGSSSAGNLFVKEALHKTYISVDERGTRAGAVTVLGVGAESAAPVEVKYVRLDRPFLYMIVDGECGLPIFIGSVNEID